MKLNLHNLNFFRHNNGNFLKIILIRSKSNKKQFRLKRKGCKQQMKEMISIRTFILNIFYYFNVSKKHKSSKFTYLVY